MRTIRVMLAAVLCAAAIIGQINSGRRHQAGAKGRENLWLAVLLLALFVGLGA